MLLLWGTGGVWGGCAPSEAGKFCKYKIEMGQFGAMFLPLFSYIVGFEIEAYVNFYFTNFFHFWGGTSPSDSPCVRLTQNKCIIFDFQKRLSLGNEGKNATQNRPISIFYLQNFPTSEGAHPPQTPPAVLVGSIVEHIILSANLGLVGKFLTATPPTRKGLRTPLGGLYENDWV